MYFNSVKVKKYKCFKENLEGFEKIQPINIIIGKNNSGKSSLIDLIEVLCTKSNLIQEIFSEYRPSFAQFRKHFEEIYSPAQSEYRLQNIYKSEIALNPILYKHSNIGNGQAFRWPTIPEINKLSENHDGYNLKAIFEKVAFRYFDKYKFRRLNAERDVNPEVSSYDISVNNSGRGVTNIIQQFLYRKDLQKQKLIKKDFLESINKIVNPEIEFSEISVQVSNTDSSWEVCFEDNFGNNVFLSKMGSGIKTIILVLANLLLLPSHEGEDIENYIFAFEELENNLHPSLQRKLYQFIKNFAEINKCVFFLTSHSNIGIDIFYNSDISQLITVTNVNGVSTCKTIIQNHHLNDLLHQLGFKASDLLQTNGIIWVEGPSDRVYIKKWISLVNKTIIEGVHYSIMFYGGKLLSHLTFSEQNLNEFILLLKINKNSYVIIDKDAKKETDRINKTKKRIQSEIGGNNCWVTNGREIENYISISCLEAWIQNKNVTGCEKIIFSKFDKLENILSCISPPYNLNKIGYSKEISNLITENDLDNLDLKARIQGIVKAIESWNS